MARRQVWSREFRARQASGEGFKHRDLRSAIELAVDGLPERQHQAVILHVFEGLKETEVAARMGISQPAVSALLKRAAKRIPAFLAWLQTRTLSATQQNVTCLPAQ